MKSYTIFQKSDDATVNAFLEWMRNQERNVYRAALRELGALKKLRPQYMQQKPVAEQFEWLKKMLSWKPAETIADHLLQVWLSRKHEGMLTSSRRLWTPCLRPIPPVLFLCTCTCSRTRPRKAGLSFRLSWITMSALPSSNF